MANTYSAPATPAGDGTAAPKSTTIENPKSDDQEICRQALERYARWYTREQDNITKAYEDLEFCWNDNQWDDTAALERRNEDRPCLTVNRLPQFVHQITGDMRQMKPGIKVVPVDSAGDKKTAEALGGMLRYIENRSHAARIYTSAADSQVSCGIGAWRVTKELAGQGTFNQEIRIVGVDDAVGIAVDPDAIIPTREDAKWMIVPVDMSKDAFEAEYPDAPVGDFDTSTPNSHGWWDNDTVRVAEYWVKVPVKRTLALMQDGAIVDLTGKDAAEVRKISATAKRVEKRDSFKVCRYLITAAHVLQKDEWPGMYIPIIFAVGEEIRIGRKVIRRGLVRSAKDPQRMFNYFCSAQAEVTALQPKSPFIGTQKNFELNAEDWAEANRKAFPYLIYTPDTSNGSIAPQRVQPPVSSQGIAEGIQLAAENMKAVIGIYDPGLGNRKGDQSGRAIVALQKEGDTGSYVYIDNWTLAIAHTGTVAADLIPHTYDTERQIRIMGEDGKIDLKWINKPVGIQEMDPNTGEMITTQKIENDVTLGAYDVVMETGPSYSTRREEAKAGMVEFIRSAPEVAPAVLDIVAKGQDWPLADEFAKRCEAIAPPAIQKQIAQEKQERGESDPQPEQADPAQQAQQQAMMLDLQNKQLSNELLQAQTNVQKETAEKLQAEIAVMMKGAQTEGQQQQPGDPTMPIEAQGKQLANDIALEKARREIALLDQQITRGEQEIHHGHLKGRQMVEDLRAKQIGTVQGIEQHEAAMMGEGDDDGGEGGDPQARAPATIVALQSIADSFQAGMEAIASAMLAPKRVVRSNNQIIGVEPMTRQ